MMSPVTRTGDKSDSNQEELGYCENPSVNEMSEDILKELQRKCEECEKEIETCDQSFQELNLQLEMLEDKESEEIKKCITDHAQKLESEYSMFVTEAEGLENLELELGNESALMENTKRILEIKLAETESLSASKEKSCSDLYQLQYELDTLNNQNISLEKVLHDLECRALSTLDSNSVLSSKLDIIENIKLLKTKEVEELKAELEVQEDDFQIRDEEFPQIITKSLFAEVDETLAGIAVEYKELGKCYSGLRRLRAEINSRLHELIFEYRSLKMNTSHADQELKKFQHEFHEQLSSDVNGLLREVVDFEKFVDNGCPETQFPKTEQSYLKDMIYCESKTLKDVDEQILSLRSEQLQIDENIALERYNAYQINNRSITLHCNNLVISNIDINPS